MKKKINVSDTIYYRVPALNNLEKVKVFQVYKDIGYFYIKEGKSYFIGKTYIINLVDEMIKAVFEEV